MTNLRKLAAICFGILLVLSLTTAGDATAVPSVDGEIQITNNTSEQVSPDIFGERIVWSDNRNGNWDIYMFDVVTKKETQITNNLSDQNDPRIYIDRIVWTDTRNGTPEVYMRDLSKPTETFIANGTDAHIDDNKIIWKDTRNSGSMSDDYGFGGFDIYMYNVDTKTETRITNETILQNPDLSNYIDIYADRIVWGTDMDGTVAVYTISTGETVILTAPLVTPLDNIVLSGDFIVGTNNREGREGSVIMHDLSTNSVTWITGNNSAYGGVDIDNKRIVWADIRKNMEPSSMDLYMYDVDTTNETRLTTTGSVMWGTPRISTDRVVWEDGRNGNTDIYMLDLPPFDRYADTGPANLEDLGYFVVDTYMCSPQTRDGLLSLLIDTYYCYKIGDNDKAVKTLKSFIHLVESMETCQQIYPAESEYMIREANKIIKNGTPLRNHI